METAEKAKLPAFFLIAICLIVTACAGQKTQFTPLPPEEMNMSFLRYKEAAGKKAYALAADPSGPWAFAYSFSKSSQAEADEEALRRCNTVRTKYDVLSKPRLFAQDNEVVYYNTPDK